MERIRVMRIVARMNIGGPAVEISELVRGLDPDRFEQRLITGWCAGDEADFLETQATDIEAVRISGFGRAVRPWDDAMVLSRLISQIREFQPHIVHTHTAKAGVLGRVAAKASGVNPKIVHTHHGHLLHGYFGPAKTRAVIEVEKALARISDRLVTVGDRVRDDLLAAGIGKANQYLVIRPGVTVDDIPSKDQARSELGIPEGMMVISMIGRLTRIKRPDRFLEVVKTIASERKDVLFVVAGSGDLEDDLRDRVESACLPVRMLGWRSDVATILAASDLILLTSDNEGTPLSLIQAGLAGVPAVATDVGSVAEVVQDKVSGILVDPESAKLARGLVALLDDAPLRTRMGHESRRWAREEFGQSRFRNIHERMYSELMAPTLGTGPL